MDLVIDGGEIFAGIRRLSTSLLRRQMSLGLAKARLTGWIKFNFERTLTDQILITGCGTYSSEVIDNETLVKAYNTHVEEYNVSTQ